MNGYPWPLFIVTGAEEGWCYGVAPTLEAALAFVYAELDELREEEDDWFEISLAMWEGRPEELLVHVRRRSDHDGPGVAHFLITEAVEFVGLRSVASEPGFARGATPASR